ncbi:MAG: DEAD/DEAH box helicase family protein [Bryobacteraceae bacterium]|nr:DEAD/DEAH box helicase family protein [Bryobacteraceae bacterium]
MPLDLNKLREAKKQPKVIDPVEIFRRLPKKADIKDLYGSQVEVLNAWFADRTKPDHVVKLHTGGGKTLVGLLIAQSIVNETSEPVVFICPNNYLVGQTLKKATEYSIPAVAYEKPFPDEFANGKAVMVSNYSTVFNGMSRFGIKGKDVLKLGGIIVDDAHVGSSILRDAFSIRIRQDDGGEAYAALSSMFRLAFKEVGQLGTFDDVVEGRDYSVLEVPYWTWLEKLDEVQGFLSDNAEQYDLHWPLLRDNLRYCHCFIERKSVVVTPIFPLVDLIPSFATCKRRVFMSATIPDDTAIIRTFDATRESLMRPLSSKSLAGVSERMILVPELLGFKVVDVLTMVRKLCESVAKKDLSTVILVPSGKAAASWTSVAEYPATPEAVEKKVADLVDDVSHGPVVLANRYDGIDLPNDSCRLLVLSGLPWAAGEYELHRANVFAGAASLNRAVAQKIEQGMGRAARGPGDYCVVIVMGKDLVSWLGKDANLRFLTTSTYSQLEMGIEISKNISDSKDFVHTLNRCFKREKDWVTYHAETLADLTFNISVKKDEIDRAAAERQALQLWRDGYHEQAIAKLTKQCDAETIEGLERGWLLQFAARIALDWGKKGHALELQQRAFAENRNLCRPPVGVPKVQIVLPGSQAKAMVEQLKPFRYKRGYVAQLEETVALLVANSSAGQFEEAMANLGTMLGFETSRPEKSYGKGPDLLWLVSKEVGLIIEAKSRKNPTNALTKAQHGQLLVSENWFKETYPKTTGIRVAIHPSVTATKNSVPTGTKALTLAKLDELVGEARKIVTALSESGHPDSELAEYCEDLLKKSNLTPDRFVKHYLVDFEVVEVN